MSSRLLAAVVVAASLAGTAFAAQVEGLYPLSHAAVRAETTTSAGSPAGADSATLTLVAEGCGPGRWRGPWGGCRGGGWAWGGPVYGGWRGGNGCPPGFWRGPWGHCRDTPYHGRLPGGGWK